MKAPKVVIFVTGAVTTSPTWKLSSTFALFARKREQDVVHEAGGEVIQDVVFAFPGFDRPIDRLDHLGDLFAEEAGGIDDQFGFMLTFVGFDHKVVIDFFDGFHRFAQGKVDAIIEGILHAVGDEGEAVHHTGARAKQSAFDLGGDVRLDGFDFLRGEEFGFHAILLPALG